MFYAWAEDVGWLRGLFRWLARSRKELTDGLGIHASGEWRYRAYPYGEIDLVACQGEFVLALGFG